MNAASRFLAGLPIALEFLTPLRFRKDTSSGTVAGAKGS